MRRAVLLLALLAATGCPEPVEEPPPLTTSECENPLLTWVDADGDGWGDADTEEALCGEIPEDRVRQGGDCDDDDATSFPQAPELCDGRDNDCDEAVDELIDHFVVYPDDDGDGFGDELRQTTACDVPEGYVQDGRDCDDTNPDAHPEADEVCDGVDNDCDSLVDDLDADIAPGSMQTFSVDADHDGFGHRTATTKACEAGPGLSLTNDDCDDSNSGVNPAATEVCSGLDEDCDNLVDDADPSVDPASQTSYFVDADYDGYGEPGSAVLACDEVPGTSSNDLDCDDSDPQIGIETHWYDDSDGDGVGGGASLGYSCFPPVPGATPQWAGTDCDDTDPTISPDAKEICEDGIDQDCDGSDPSCGPIGNFNVNDGPSWTVDPPVRSCLDTCALLFGGIASDYACSTSPTNLNHLSYVSGWGDGTFCTSPVDEDYKKEQAGNPGYNCGSTGCAYSAWVQDHCTSGLSINYCWEQ